MANYIPLVLQIEIFYHLPVKSLIRFQSVSKEWKSLIDSPEFESDYIVSQAQRKRLLLRVNRGYWVLDDDDDDTFPQHMISSRYPQSVNYFTLVCSSHGLVCFISGSYLGEDNNNNVLNRCDIFWNLYGTCGKLVEIESVAIDLPYNGGGSVGFGVCPVVKINNVIFKREGSRFIKLPSKWLNIQLSAQTSLVINGFVYWVVSTVVDCNYFILSFDLTSDEFTKIDVPNTLAHNNFDIFIFKESLSVIQREGTTFQGNEVYKVWLMDHVSKSFIVLFNVTLQPKWRVVGFNDKDQLIIVYTDGYKAQLLAYNPNLSHLINLGVYGRCSSFTCA
ncbi:F-box protein At3g57590-like [Rutidosis leptorrhynchoides]|uniref:F-box protein At3g57590-like n=1 Tax=Rutidosis leptorrhynchoides TaxID=125765 RepID=UPI003A99B809